MAEISFKKSINVKLTLNDKETKYLHGLLQNYLGEDTDLEEPEHVQIRTCIYELLSSALSYD
jgi:hypothetical protein